ncbi:hypothetical protein V1498_03600 [Peribacillus sp. SCS-26]|uniref:hypothetical protein n=1 Tax=Paraperibacillus TaxID=3450404 RepID=UPI003906C4E8
MDAKVLNAVKFVGGAILSIGIIFFVIGFTASGSSVWTPIGIGTVMGAIFIFLMGIFLVATEEVLEKSYRRKRI